MDPLFQAVENRNLTEAGIPPDRSTGKAFEQTLTRRHRDWQAWAVQPFYTSGPQPSHKGDKTGIQPNLGARNAVFRGDKPSLGARSAYPPHFLHIMSTGPACLPRTVCQACQSGFAIGVYCKGPRPASGSLETLWRWDWRACWGWSYSDGLALALGLGRPSRGTGVMIHVWGI